MSIERKRNYVGQLATRCGSFWIFCTVWGSQHSVDAFHFRPPCNACIAAHGARQSRHVRIPSILTAKGRKALEDDAAPSKQNKVSTRKLLEQESRYTPTTTKPPRKTSSLYQSEFLSHDILSPDEEKALGKKIRKAMALKEEIRVIIDEKEAVDFERFIKQQEYNRLILEGDYSDFGTETEEEEEDFSSLLTHGLDGCFVEETRRQKNQVAANIEILPVDKYLDDLWATNADEEGNSSSGGIQQNILNDIDLDRLGGREKVSQILIEGAIAREKMISSNIRLVLSVAKKWCKNSAKSNGSSDKSTAVYGELDQTKS